MVVVYKARDHMNCINAKSHKDYACPKCYGSGRVVRDEYLIECPMCYGKGRREKFPTHGEKINVSTE